MKKRLKMFIRGLSPTEYHQHPELKDLIIIDANGNARTEELKKKYDKYSEIHTGIQ